MSHDEIDRILSHDEELLPSSGFAASVMDAVRREAAVPPPIPFPWKRALPGLAVAGLTLVLVVLVFAAEATQLGREAPSAQVSVWWMSRLTPIMMATTTPTAGWTLLALALTLASVIFPLRLAGRRT
ncbi:MAG: hypothetical protein LAO22_07825 [Acidobacteriia bacterium]|nr:hypothetical protein [Terriglobia bacterium]